MEKPIFKLIVAGSRDFCNLAVVREVVDKMLANKLETHRIEIVSGGARGPDTLGRAIAIEHGWRVSVMNADWEKEGKAAGMKRNQRMADYADAALVFWDGNSPGTRNMIQTMIEMRKPIRIAMVDCINQSFVTFASTRELIARG